MVAVCRRPEVAACLFFVHTGLMRQLSEDDDLITADALSVRAAPPSSGCTTDANDDAVINWWLELGCACVALVIWQIGRVYWGMVARRHPLRTIGGTMRAARRSWVREHLNKGMVPVNTMRDFMKAAEFMARTSVLVVFAVSSYAVAVVAPKVTHGVVALRAPIWSRANPGTAGPRWRLCYSCIRASYRDRARLPLPALHQAAGDPAAPRVQFRGVHASRPLRQSRQLVSPWLGRPCSNPGTRRV